MKGDISRSTFDPHKHYSSVRMQQGRVQVDADWNEQADILLHLLRTQMADLLGPGAAAASEQGFAITVREPAGQGEPDPESTTPSITLPDFEIGAGRFYVAGILCENEVPVLFSKQPDYPAAASLTQGPADCNQYIVYLDVWQRDITAAEDPAIREIALGGPDTTTRLKTVWQVKLLSLSSALGESQRWRDHAALRSLDEWVAFVNSKGQPLRLKARRNPSSTALLDNRLYRVEIHTAGDQPTFKWSRENGSVVLPITDIMPPPKPVDETSFLQVTVENLEHDPYQIQEGSWVELTDDVTVLNGSPLPLCKVVELDRVKGYVKLQATMDAIDRIWAEIGERKDRPHLMRRWEEGEKLVHPANTAGDTHQEWIELENGIQVAFEDNGSCQPGDYWLIPARTQLEDSIDWPEKGDPFQPTHGLPHYFAPLALLRFELGRWSVTQPTSFQTLPEVTAQLSATDRELQDVSGRLRQTEETVHTTARLTHGLSSDLSQLQVTVDTLESKTDRVSASLGHLHEAVDKLKAKVGSPVSTLPVHAWLIPLVVAIGLLLAYLIYLQGNQNNLAFASQQATAQAMQTAVAQNGIALQQANETIRAQNVDANANAIQRANQTAIAQQATAIQQANQRATAQQATANAIQQANQTAIAQQATAIQQALAQLCSIPSQVSFLNVKISKVTVKGQTFDGVCYEASPGETITVKLEYQISREAVCPFCIDQILVGFSHEITPRECFYDKVVPDPSETGTHDISVKIPVNPGIYYLAVDRPQLLPLCAGAIKQWWSSYKPRANQYFLAIHVP